MKRLLFQLLSFLVILIIFTGCAKAPVIPPVIGGEISAPRNLSMFLKPDSIDLKWEVPEKNSDKIQKYILRIDVDGNLLNLELPGDANSYSLNEFSELKVYKFDVKPEAQNYDSKSASITSNDKKNVFVQIKGQILDGVNNTLPVNGASIELLAGIAKFASVFSGINGDFEVFISRNSDKIILNHPDYSKTIIDSTSLNSQLTESYIPKNDIVFLIQPLNLEQEVIAEEGAVIGDDDGINVQIDSNTFDDDVNVVLSTSGEDNSSDSVLNSSLKNINFGVSDSSGNEVQFKKPVSINMDFANSSSSMPSRLMPTFASTSPKLSEVIRAVTEIADLKFIFTQKKNNGERVSLKGEFDPDTMNATLLADSAGVFSLVPDIYIPVFMKNSSFDSQSSSRDSGLKVSVDLDIEVFSKELIEKYYGGILTANFEFDVFERENNTDKLITSKVVQRTYLGVENIKPVFDMAYMADVKTDYRTDNSAEKETGYEFFVNVDEAALLNHSSKKIPDDETLEDFFSSVEDVQLLDNFENGKVYIVKMRYRLATPFGKITQEFNIGSFSNDGEQKPPLSSKILNVQSTTDSIFVEWEECTETNFDYYEIHIKQTGTLNPWEKVVECKSNSATITSETYNIFQNSKYSLKIYTYNDAGLFSIGESTDTVTKNKPPEVCNLYISGVENGVTSNSVLLKWQFSDEPDFDRYEILWEESNQANVQRVSENASKAIISIRTADNIRIENLTANTNYDFELRVYDTAGEKSVSSINVTTDDFTPPVAPEIKIKSVEKKIDGQYEFKIYWKDLSLSEEGYRVFKDGQKIGPDLPADSYKFVETMSATPGYSVNFSIQAYLGEFVAQNDCEIYVPEEIEKPEKPAITVIDKGSDFITVQWDKQDNVINYKTYISLDGNNWILRKSSKIENFTILDGLKSNTEYLIRVVITNISGINSDEIKVITNVPPKFVGPENLNCGGKSFNYVSLEWSEVSDSLGYYVYRKDAGNFNMIGYTSQIKREFRDNNVKSETNYTYEVRAYNPARGGESTENPTVTVITDKAPTVPASPAIEEIFYDGDIDNLGNINLIWDCNSEDNIEGYLVNKKIESDEKGIINKLITTTEKFLVDSNLITDATFTYKVKSYNSVGSGEWSEESTPIYVGKTDVPPSKANLISPENNQEDLPVNIKFVWTASEDKNDDFSHYDLYLYKTNSAEATIARIEGENNTSYFAELLEYDTQYRWKVRAYDKSGNCSDSEMRTFSTKPEIVKNIFGQLSSISLNPAGTGQVNLIVKGAKGLKSMKLKIQYSDLLESLILKYPVQESSGRFTLKNGEFDITLPASITTDDAIKVAEFEVKSSNNAGVCDLILHPTSEFKDVEGKVIPASVLKGKVEVIAKKKGAVTLNAVENKISMGKSIELNMNFKDIDNPKKVEIKIFKKGNIREYENTGWADLAENVHIAHVITADYISITLESTMGTVSITGDRILRFLPEDGDKDYRFLLESVKLTDGNGNETFAHVFGDTGVSVSGPKMDLQLQAIRSFGVEKGQKFDSTVSVSGDSEINMLEFDMNYDSDKLDVTPQINSLLDNATVTFNKLADGYIKFKIESPVLSEITGDLVKVEYEAVSPGNAFIQISNVKVKYFIDESIQLKYMPQGAIDGVAKEIQINSDNPEFIMPDVSVEKDSTFTYNIGLTKIEDLKSFEIVLDYSPVYCENPVVYFTDSLGIFKTIVKSINVNFGETELTITGAASESVDIFNENIFGIQFGSIKEGISYIMIDPKTKLYDSHGDEIEVNIDDTGRILAQ